jgi:subtilisin family serine protease
MDAYSDVWGPNLTSIVQFTDHIVAGRLTDYASTDSAVIAGVHVIRTEWTDVDGISRQITNEGSLDELWMKSSGGPKRDGTLHGVDVSASGQNSFVSTSADTYWGSLRFNLIQDGGGWYGRFGGTSGSAPIVVGAVALMLQMNPDLTAQQVREILRDTARDDSFTGSTPNADWGFGKLDVLAALDRVAQPVPTVSEWGVLVMGLLTATGGTLVLRSRYRGTAEFSST